MFHVVFLLAASFLLFPCYLPSSLSSFVFATSVGYLFASSCRLLSSPLSLDPYPVLFLPFLPCTSRMPASTRPEPGQWDAFRSVATVVERRFYNEGLYLGKRLRLPHCIEELPFSFTPCQVLHRRCRRERRATAGARSFKGVLRFIAGRHYESNAFAEYFRSYEMRVERRPRAARKSVLSPVETYLSSRPINVSGPRLLFFSPRDIRPRFKIASSSTFPVLLASISSSLFAFRSFFRSSRRSHLLVDISSFSPPYLRSFQVPFVVRSLFPFSSSTARLSDTISLFSCNLLTTFQRGKVMRTGYSTQG